MLGDRLQLLQRPGLVRWATLAPPAASTVYELTDRGRQLRPVLLTLAGWGLPPAGQPPRRGRLPARLAGPDARGAVRPAGRRGVELACELGVGDGVLHVNVRDGAVQTLQRPAPAPEVVLEVDRDVFLAWGTGQLDDEQALAAGLRVTPAPRRSSSCGGCSPTAYQQKPNPEGGVSRPPQAWLGPAAGSPRAALVFALLTPAGGGVARLMVAQREVTKLMRPTAEGRALGARRRLKRPACHAAQRL